MKLRFVILTSLILATFNIYGQPIKKCDGAVILVTKNKLGQLTQGEITNFLLTFGQECRNNVEYTEFSNEILFDLLDMQTELLVKTMKSEESKISNRLEKLKGNLKEYYSIRVNDQWRIIFKWDKGNAADVEILDYH
jgi:plasmid maintenance system killer protein